MDLDRIRWQSMLPVAARNFCGKYGACRAIYVPDWQMHLDRLLVLERITAEFDELTIERLLKPVVLLFDAMKRPIRRHRGFSENCAEIDIASLPVINCFV